MICEELQAAIERIDEKMQALEQEAPEKYQIPEDVAAEEFGLLNELFVLVNNQMMEQLGMAILMRRSRHCLPMRLLILLVVRRTR